MSTVSEMMAEQISNAQVNVQTWGGIFINVKSYGAKGIGTTDDTTEIQTAFNDASISNVPVFFPSGTYDITQVIIPSGLKLWGTGPLTSIIRRKANSLTNQAIVKALNSDSIELEGLGFDGNKANQTLNAQNVLFSFCSNISINNCRFFNSLRSGLFMENSTNETAKDRSIVQFSKFDNNEEMGMYVNNESHLIVTTSKFFNNTGSGFNTLGTLNKNISFISNETAYNGYHGVCFAGHFNNSFTDNGCFDCVVSENDVHHNLLWGVTFQCTGGTVSNNQIKLNGSTTDHAGLLINGFDNNIVGNTIDSNYYYGIDMGDAFNCNFTSNFVRFNGNVTDGGVGLNVESCGVININDNFFYNNGNASGGYQISIHGIGGAGPLTPFRGLNTNITVEGNKLSAGNSSQYGLYIDTSSSNVLATGNQMVGFVDSIHAMQYSCISGPKCKNNHYPSMINPIVTAAASIVIPDDGDLIFITGTTTITEILTDSANLFKQKVSRIDITNFGTGYTSAPAVAITGGAGVGATAQAYVDLPTGLLTAIAVTNGGSGYTSAPTIGITGGGGASAAAISVVGCNNYPGRQITLKFGASVTLNNTGNLKLVGGSFNATATSTLTLMGEYGQWYELSRSTT